MTRNNALQVIGSLLLTFNAMAQWTKLKSGTVEDLYSVHFPARDTGYVAGTNGAVLKTVDNGDHWIELSVGPGKHFHCVRFIDAQTGYVVGDSGLIVKTTTGGASWSILHADPSATLSSVFFSDELHGFAVGDSSANPLVLRTDDAGSHWRRSGISNTQPIYHLYAVHFPVPDTGYISYRSGVLKSTDAGSTWFQIISTPPDTAFPFSVLQGCYFTSSTTGYVAGWYDGALARTSDGGNSWTTINSFQLFSVFFPNPAIGYAAGLGATVGGDGKIIKTTDSGATWAAQSTPESAGFEAIICVDANVAFAVGYHGTIVRTTNGGVTSVGPPGNRPPSSIELYQNYPNPFNPSTTISFRLTRSGFVSLSIYDVLGRTVQTLVHGLKPAGEHTVTWNPLDRPGGIYFYRLETDGLSRSRKLLYLK